MPDNRVVISIDIQKQCEMLDSRLNVELLTSDESNREKVRSFRADKLGKGLELYLKENAWNDDQNGVTKVYLVKDSDDIVFYFALSAGLLYKEIGSDDSQLSEEEKEIVRLCVEAALKGNTDYTTDEVLSWYEDGLIDKDRLRKLIKKRIELKLAARDDSERTKNTVNVRQVAETFPGIVLTHFCKNAEYSCPESLSFPIGFYVFWEIVVKKVLQIASYIGCQYLYLFAADNTETPIKEISALYPEDWEADDDFDIMPTYRLVDYYKNELKFEEVQDVAMLKPYYDFSCFSLIQETNLLSEHRNAAWVQHSDVNDGL